jgi:hypothetical protein
MPSTGQVTVLAIQTIGILLQTAATQGLPGSSEVSLRSPRPGGKPGSTGSWLAFQCSDNLKLECKSPDLPLDAPSNLILLEY